MSAGDAWAMTLLTLVRRCRLNLSPPELMSDYCARVGEDQRWGVFKYNDKWWHEDPDDDKNYPDQPRWVECYAGCIRRISVRQEREGRRGL